MKNKSLRAHFLLLYILLAVLSGIVVPALGALLSRNAFMKYQTEKLQADLESLKNSLDELFNEDGIWKRRRVMDILRPAPQWGGMRIILRDSNNYEIYTLKPPNIRSAIVEGVQTQHINIQLENGSLEIFRRIPSGRYEEKFISYLTWYTLAGALIMILIACGLGFVISEKLSRPVINAIKRTKKISNGDYNFNDENIKPSGISELDELLKSVNLLGRSLANQEILRQRLMTDIAHELKTPLTVTRTQIEAIADGILQPTPERLNLCVNEMERLGSLIEDVESLSRLEGENIELRTENINLKKFLENIIESFQPLFKQHKIKIVSQLENNIYSEIDPDRFRHAIDNLLSNALRYTDAGGVVKINLYRDKSKNNKNNNNNIVIEVSDNGTGINKNDLPHIFDRFYRTDESRARVTGGKGVGLSIVKASVEAHGGNISVESEINKGSCFKINLPD